MARGSNKQKMFSLLRELLKDSSRSDRALAKTVGMSQPTVSRNKKFLKEKGLITGFSVVPNFFKIGYELMALTFVRTKTSLSSIEERQKGHEIVRNWMMKQPNVIFCSYCRGLDSDGFMISLHASYKDFDDFIEKHNRALGNLLDGIKSSLVNLDESQVIKPLHFKYLAEGSQ